MNPIRLFGRRQFLVAAGASSVSALAFNKLAQIVGPDFQSAAAMAADNASRPRRLIAWTRGASTTATACPAIRLSVLRPAPAARA